MLNDLRFSLRGLLQAKGFTIAAVSTLAVGIGATTVVYSIVDGLLLRPLPYGDRADRLVTLHATHPTQTAQLDDSGVSYADMSDFRESTQRFEAIEGVLTRSVSLASDDDSERVPAASITTGLFRMLGVAPARGRDFEAGEGARMGFEQIAIISDGLWKRLYGSDPAVVGKTIRMNGRSLSIVGVMPPAFAFPEAQQIWLPYRQPRDADRDRRAFLTVGLLKHGATVREARAELDAVAASLAAKYPESNRAWGIHIAPMREFYVPGSVRLGLVTMLGAVSLVLLVSCVNIAGLLVARGIGRQRELTLRAALGADRSRLLRLLLSESLILAAAGGALGLMIASWGLAAVLASNPEPPPSWAMPSIDRRVLVFVALLSAAAAIAAGLVPAWRVSRVRVAQSLAPGTRAAGPTADQRRLQSSLVAAQVAISFVLLMAATLMSRSAMQLQHGDAGFDPAPLASLRFYMAGNAYDDPAARAQAVAQVVDRLERIPGVRAASAAGAIPADDGGSPVRAAADSATERGMETGASLVPVTPGFWRTIGREVIDGRAFTGSEALTTDPGVIIVSARLAATFWPGETAVGRTLRVIEPQRTGVHRVVGVAADLVYEELGEETEQSRLVIYVPYSQAGWRTMAALMRVEGDPASVLQPARAVVRSVDPAFAAFDMQTMTGRRAITQWAERFIGRTFGLFALAGLLLACIGAYGLTAYSAAQREREIGIRIAIGATGRQIVRLLLARGVRLALIGTIIGVPVAALAASGVRGLLYNVSPWEPTVWTAVPAVLVAAVLIASYLPARRASGIDPAVALRAE